MLDRVGGGDGFASGFIYGLLSGGTPEEAVKLGLGSRRVDDHLPRRYDDVDAGAGQGVLPQAARRAFSANGSS